MSITLRPRENGKLDASDDMFVRKSTNVCTLVFSSDMLDFVLRTTHDSRFVQQIKARDSDNHG